MSASIRCQMGTASDGLEAPVDSAIKAPHRVTEGDRFPGLPTERGHPGGVQAAETIRASHPARSPQRILNPIILNLEFNKPPVSLIPTNVTSIT